MMHQPLSKACFNVGLLWSSPIALLIGLGSTCITLPAYSQLIPDNTLGAESSLVTPDTFQGVDGDRITGGATRADFLFHSFEEFNIDSGRAAYFSSPDGIANILSRVTGANQSDILGRLGVDGNANLFLLNPHGIVFGPEATLDIAGSFVATTADRFTFLHGTEFSAIDPQSAPLLTVSTPVGLQYGSGRSGSIINAGNLDVSDDENLTLTGSTVVNTGTLTANGGEVAIASISGPNQLQFNTQGQLREITSLADLVIPATPDAPSIPEIVANVPVDLGLTVDDTGQVSVTDSGTLIPTAVGDALVTGVINVADDSVGQIGGEAVVVGDRVALFDQAMIDVSGNAGGGTALIGGSYQGQGRLPNARQAYIGPDTAIMADALTRGDGGRVIVWADGTTDFYGDISAQGGNVAGDGGFVEVSGQTHLRYRGAVSTTAVTGALGTLLIDPVDIVIANGDGASDDSDGTVLGSDPGNAITIFEETLEGLNGDTNVTLQATNDITIQDLTDLDGDGFLVDNALTFQAGTGAIAFMADSDGNNAGSFTMESSNSIITNGRDLNIFGANLTIGSLDTTTVEPDSDSGSIQLAATGNINIGVLDDTGFSNNFITTSTFGNGDAGQVTITSTNGAITLTNSSINTTTSGDGAGNAGQVTISSGYSASATNNRDVEMANPAIQLTDTGIDAASFNPGGRSGDVTIRAENGAVKLDSPSGFSTIFTDTFASAASVAGTQTGGNLTITGAHIDIDGYTLNAVAREVGNGGDIRLTALNRGSVTLTETEITAATGVAAAEGGIDENSDSSADGGSILIEAGDVSLNSSEIVTRVRLGAFGRGGDISIGAGQIQLNDSSIDAGTSGDNSNSDAPDSAQGGNINLMGSGGITLENNSSISVETQFNGRGGNLTLDSQFLYLQDSTLNARVRSRGEGGSIAIATNGTNAFTTSVATGDIAPSADGTTTTETFGIFLDNSQISAVVESGATASGGNVAITTESLAVRNGSLIQAETRGSGDAGNIALNATRLIDIRGTNDDAFNSGISVSSETPNSGLGGNITINSSETRRGTLILAQNGFLNALTRSKESDAGNITVNVDTVNLQSGGQILAASLGDANAGAIEINAVSQILIEGEGTEETSPAALSAEVLGDTLTPLEFSNVTNNEAQETFNQTGDGEFAYFSFEVTESDSQGIFDINTNNSNLDTELFLFDQQTGELLATNDDFFDESSGIFSADPLIDFTFGEDGNYVIGVGQFDSEASDGSLITGEPVTNGANYTLQVSLANAANGQTELLRTNPNPNRGLDLSSGLFALADSGGNAGRIDLNTATLTITNNGLIEVSSTNGNGTSGDVTIDANVVELTDGRVEAQTDAGRGGDITFVGLEDLSVTRSEIATSTQTGMAGNIVMNQGSAPANTVLVSGAESQIAAEANAEGGSAGNVSLNVRALTVMSDGAVTASNRSSVDAATVSSVVLSGVEDLQVLSGGQITASTDTGIAGNVVVNDGGNAAPTILVTGAGSQIAAAATEAGGNAGNVSLNVRELTVASDGVITASNRSSVDAATVSSVVLSGVEDLQVLSGGQITASTDTGTAGNVVVNDNGNAATTILVRGMESQIAAAAAAAGGSAGNVDLNVQELHVLNGGEITSSTQTGAAGNVLVNRNQDAATTILVRGDGSQIAASNQNSDSGGNVNLNVQALRVLNGGQITSSTQTGAAGNVLVNRDRDPATTILVRGDGSQIAASNQNSDSGGNVNLNVQALRVLDGGTLTSSTRTGTAGNVRINADSDRPATTIFVSGNGTQIAARASGEGGTSGSVFINVQELMVQDRGRITTANISGMQDTENSSSILLSDLETLQVRSGGRITSSTVSGTAGDILISGNNDPVQAIVVSGNGSQIAARATDNAAGGGNAGNVMLNVRALTVENDGRITASTTSGGDAEAPSSVQVSGLEQLMVQGDGRITASTRTGEAGNILINTDGAGNTNGDRPANTILVSGNGSRIAAQASDDSGNAGNVILNVRDLTVEAEGRITASTISGGDGGNPSSVILLGVEALRVLSGGEITASTDTGVAGDVVVNDPDSPANFIIVSGEGSLIAVEATGRSSLSQSEPELGENSRSVGRLANSDRDNVSDDGGTAGNIELYTRQLTVEDGGEISVSSESGVAGRLLVRANAITLNNGALTASTAASGGSNDSATIRLVLGDYSLFSSDNHLENSLVLRNNSVIQADARGDANGGNIIIRAPQGYVIGTGNSDIIATAEQGTGGNIELTALQVFIFGLRQTITNAAGVEALRNNTTSDVSASSEFGNDGAVIIDSLGVDPSEGLVELPATVTTVPPIDAVCAAQSQGNNEFVQIGRGGVPAQPSDIRRSTLALPGWVTPDSVVFDTASSAAVSIEFDTVSPSFIEAQGWRQEMDQTIRLTTTPTHNVSPLLTPSGNKLCDSN